MTAGGAGNGLPQVMVTLEHRSVGGEGTTVTMRVQLVTLLQQSAACQVWKMVLPLPQPLSLVMLLISVTVTLLQHRPIATGGLGKGLPQVMVALLHTICSGGPSRNSVTRPRVSAPPVALPTPP